MFYCIDNEGDIYEGKTLTECYRKADKSGSVYEMEDVTFIDGQKVKVEFEVVPATQVKAVKKKGSK